MTTAPKPDLPSIAFFDAGEVSDARRYAIADDIWPLPKNALLRRVGALTPRQMERVERAIVVALDL